MARALFRSIVLALAVSLLPVAAVSAQQKLLTLDDLYGVANRIAFSGTPAPAFEWIDAEHYAWPRPTADRNIVDWLAVEATSGATRPLFDSAKAEASLAALPGVNASDARRAVHSRDIVFDKAHTSALLTIGDDLYRLTFNGPIATRATFSPGTKEEATLSPNGLNVAFVRGNNLFLVDLATGTETAVTQDGSARVLNGKMDWVYEEEIYGRGTTRAYWWSPDSSRLAFLRIDDTPVSSYITLDDISYDPRVETWFYPRAGGANPSVRLAVVRANGGNKDWIDLSKYSAEDFLIVRVGWTAKSELSYQVENRIQSWLDLDLADVSASTPASSRTLFRETTKFWINSEDQSLPTWLHDGSFLWLSSRSGFPHVYHYNADGSLRRQVTSGQWEVRTVHGVDEQNGWLYFSGTERTATGGDVYRIRLDGTGLVRLSQATGTHDAEFNPGLTYYIDRWSAILTPPQLRLHRADGRELRVLHPNIVDALTQYRLSTPEFLQVKTRDGFVMEAMMIKPPDFDPRKKYPVYQFTYGGPHTPQVRNAWVPQTMYHELLAQKGIIVWICDNRSASGKGLEATSTVYHHFGDGELRDIEDGLSWLKQQPYVDGARIGIHGWSYGGFMTTYALTHSTSFVMGIAGGTVSDWRDYDTVYTERYLGLPQDNPDGYRNSSPRFSAANLHGSLLLIHGAIDDNVHVQNTMQLVYELQKANKPFSLMLYPKSRHGITDPVLVRHWRGMMLDYTLEHLKP